MKEEHLFDDIKFEDFVVVSELIEEIRSQLKINEQDIIMIVMLIGMQHAVDALGKDVGFKTLRKMFETAVYNVNHAADNKAASRN